MFGALEAGSFPGLLNFFSIAHVAARAASGLRFDFGAAITNGAVRNASMSSQAEVFPAQERLRPCFFQKKSQDVGLKDVLSSLAEVASATTHFTMQQIATCRDDGHAPVPGDEYR